MGQTFIMTDDGPVEYDEVTPGLFRIKGTQTRERGRRYDRNKVCPQCFASFTCKGIARHLEACQAKAALTPPPNLPTTPSMNTTHQVDGKDPILTSTVLNPRPTK